MYGLNKDFIVSFTGYVLLTFRRSNRSSSGSLFSINNWRFLNTYKKQNTHEYRDSDIANKKKTLLPYPFLHRDFVVVADGVFTQEVKLHHILLAIILWIQFDVFNSQRAAAHSVRSLSFLLLIARSQSQLEHIRTAGLKLAYKDITLTAASVYAPTVTWQCQ